MNIKSVQAAQANRSSVNFGALNLKEAQWLVIGNAKANPYPINLAFKLANDTVNLTKKGIVGIAPTALELNEICQMFKNRRSQIMVGAQGFCEKCGAFTEQIAASLFRKAGADFAIIGHSEARALLGETNEKVASKVMTAMEHELTPIMCVGESSEVRESGKALQFITHQAMSGLNNVPTEKMKDVVVAYEPIWAIGQKVCAPDMAEEACFAIRKAIAEKHGDEIAKNVKILYGGSVKPENSAELASKKNIDGFLVGAACLKPEFAQIAENTAEAKKLI